MNQQREQACLGAAHALERLAAEAQTVRTAVAATYGALALRSAAESLRAADGVGQVFLVIGEAVDPAWPEEWICGAFRNVDEARRIASRLTGCAQALLGAIQREPGMALSDLEREIMRNSLSEQDPQVRVGALGARWSARLLSVK